MTAAPRVIVGILFLQSVALAQQPARPTVGNPLQISLADRLKVFDKAWETTNKYFYDPKFNGVDWAQMRAKWRPVAENLGTDKIKLADVIQRLLNELHASHTEIRASDVAPSPYGTGVHYVPSDSRHVASC